MTLRWSTILPPIALGISCITDPVIHLLACSCQSSCMTNIHHHDPVKRLAAARAAPRPHVVPETWPAFWTGVSNPWLVFLGPSPGNSPGKARPNGPRAPTLGVPHPHVATYIDSNGFWERIREWSHRSFTLAGVFDEPKDSLSSVLIGNILATSAGDSRKLDASDLREGIPPAAKIIRWLQPRLVVTMDKRISEPLSIALVAEGMTISNSVQLKVPAKNQTYAFYRPRLWDLHDKVSRIRVLEAPQHPTKRNFYDAAVMDAFLAAHIKTLAAS